MNIRAIGPAAVFSFFLLQAPASQFDFPPPPPLKPVLQPQQIPFSAPVVPKELIRKAARKHKLPAAFIKSIMAAESAFHPDAISPKGAVGWMQVMPATAQGFGLDATNPEQNVEAGAHYLAFLWARYRNRYRGWLKRVIAAYNAGPGAVDRYRGVPPFQETRAYVARVLQYYKLFQREG